MLGTLQAFFFFFLVVMVDDETSNGLMQKGGEKEEMELSEIYIVAPICRKITLFKLLAMMVFAAYN